MGKRRSIRNVILLFLDRIFGKHLPEDLKEYDGIRVASRCRYCGRRIVLDSRKGRWFLLNQGMRG